eukprot:scaffold884_cov398-Prasinococcus_capsulatus_cf.AAC.13
MPQPSGSHPCAACAADQDWSCSPCGRPCSLDTVETAHIEHTVVAAEPRAGVEPLCGPELRVAYLCHPIDRTVACWCRSPPLIPDPHIGRTAYAGRRASARSAGAQRLGCLQALGGTASSCVGVPWHGYTARQTSFPAHAACLAFLIEEREYLAQNADDLLTGAALGPACIA